MTENCFTSPLQKCLEEAQLPSPYHGLPKYWEDARHEHYNPILFPFPDLLPDHIDRSGHHSSFSAGFKAAHLAVTQCYGPLQVERATLIEELGIHFSLSMINDTEALEGAVGVAISRSCPEVILGRCAQFLSENSFMSEAVLQTLESNPHYKYILPKSFELGMGAASLVLHTQLIKKMVAQETPDPNEDLFVPNEWCNQ